ncbi:MAG TPA: molybdopterin-dependent oxidoreductase [Thermoplasmata archaeon]|nr:molybdopterin-dependent oxidoreductase [Thermoplasmata archaeon]
MPSALGGLAARLRRLPWNRFFAGVVAGAAALVVTLIMRVLGLGVFLPEIALNFVITRIPGSLESFFISSLGEGAKGLGFVSALVAVEVAFGLGAIVYRRIEALVARRIAVIAVYTVSAAAVSLLVALPLLGAGLAGSATDVGVAFAVLSQLIGGWIYAAVLDYFLVDVAHRHPEGFSPSRRQFFIGAAAAVATLAFAFETFSTTVVQPARLAFASLADLIASEVTPTDSFYVVTKNLIDPTVDASTWSLAVDGLVGSPLTMDYASLQAKMQSGSLTSVQQYATMECVSNEVGGNLIGTAKWAGVRLADLLTMAGIEPTADWVEFTCVDGYTVAIPIAHATDPATLLVLEMNDAPLEGRHGGPARILVPGKYGMFSAKWVNRITAVQGEYLGYWQQAGKGWTNNGPIQTEALIATPPDGSVVSGSPTVGGFAVSAAAGISKVEVSTDGGATWSAAQLRSPKDPHLTWVLWTFPWSPPSGGAYNIVARAYDGNGVVQSATVAPPYPNGASGYDHITLLVSR